MSLFSKLSFTGFIFLLAGCSQIPDQPNYRPSASLPDYQQSSFSEYAQETRSWVEKNRVFLTSDKQAELAANSPFELEPQSTVKPTRGILLVHGLGDSPGYFSDIASELAQQGFLVRSMLLPGHGSKPADLMLPAFSDWEKAVKHQTNLLSQEVDEIWLGGFSTGGNLVTTEALNNDNIKGLLLFSPGYVPRYKATALAPYARWFRDWADIDTENNYMRYDSLAMNGAALYYLSAKKVQNELSSQQWDKPALITISEDDSVISAEDVISLFNTRFTHPDSRLIWFGNTPAVKDQRVITLAKSQSDKNISNIAHMSVLFSPDNPYYGRVGSYRMCNNGQTEAAEVKCPLTTDIWYSAWGYQEPDKIHARLTWNPYFSQTIQTLEEVTHSAGLTTAP